MNAPQSHQPDVKMWPLSQLRDHPENREIYPHLPDIELLRLIENIRVNGLKHPIEVLPDGTIVSGHQRVRAFKVLGRESIPCIVRHDLAKDEELALQALIDDNLQRRQLSTLGMARALHQRQESVARQADAGYHPNDIAPTLAALCKMTVRNAQRYAALLWAPIEIQQAFERNELSLSLAVDAAKLAPGAQGRIIADIAKGKPPKDAVKARLGQRPRREPSDEKRVHRLVQAAVSAMHEMSDFLAGNNLSAEFRAAIRQAHAVLNNRLTA